jgi:hypothetical protein
MFTDAIDAGIVSANPFANLRFEQSKGRKDLEALTSEQVIALADASLKAYAKDGCGFVMRAWVLLMGFTGIRPQESCVIE